MTHKHREQTWLQKWGEGKPGEWDYEAQTSRYKWMGFPSDPVVKNTPANSRDVGSVPGMGPHMQWATKQAPGSLRLCSATREATAMRSPHTETRVAPLTATRENRSPHSNEDPVQPKINKSFLKKQKMSHRDIMYSTGNIVNNIVILLYGDRW